MHTLAQVKKNYPHCVVYKYDGAFHLIPRSLIFQQGLTDKDVKEVISLQKKRIDIEDEINKAICKADVDVDLLASWTENEYALQRVWRFEQDSKFHVFWYMKGCDCPKMDNDEAYPSGFYIRSKDCKYHGWE